MIIKIFNRLIFFLIFVFWLQVLDAQTLPTATITSGDARFCEAGTATIVIEFTGDPPFAFRYADGSGSTYLVGTNADNNLTITENIFEYELYQEKTATITLTQVYDNNYQLDGDGSTEVNGSVTIQIDTQPTCDAGNDDTICGYSYFLQGTVTDTTHDIWWENQNTDGSFYNATSDTTTFTGGGASTYSLMLHEVNGACRDSSSVDITFKGRPTAQIISDTYNFCSTDDLSDAAPVEINFVGTGDYTYVVKTNDQTYDAQTVSGTTITNSYTVTQSETFVLASVVDNTTQCVSNADELTGAVNAVDLKPSISAGEDDRVCGNEYVLNGSIDEGNSGTWTSGIVGVVFSDPTNSKTSVSYADLNNYEDVTLTWTVSEPQMSCAETDDVVISFVGYPAFSIVNVSDEICEGSESEIEYTVGGNYPLSLIYSEGTTNYSEDNILNSTGSFYVNPEKIDDPETLSYLATYQLSKIVDTYGCATEYNDISYVVTVDNLPSPDAGIEDEVCGKLVSLEATPSIGDGIWSGIGSFDDVENNITNFESDEFGEQYLKWTETNGVCVASDSVLVDFQKAAYPVYAGADTIIYGVDKIQLNATELSEGSGIWSVSGGFGSFDDETNSKTLVTNLIPGEYQFYWTASIDGAESCGDLTDTVNVKIKKLLVPSGFSPNGDGINDWFRIYGCSNITDNKLSVFDRYGKLVYQVKGYDNSDEKKWYGEDNNGHELKDGTYYVVFEGKELSSPVKTFLIIKR